MISTQPTIKFASCLIPDSLQCKLRWRQNVLMVEKNDYPNTLLLSLRNSQRIVACLERSPIERVKLDLSLEENTLILWAEACMQAGKEAFVRLPGSSELPQKRAKVTWWLKCFCDRIAAIVLLTLFLPVLAVLTMLVKFSSPGPIFFQQWRVGRRGKLFKIFKFRTMIVGAEKLHHQVMLNQPGLHKLENDPRITAIGYWLRKYSLDELPQLLNVLRGDMSLVGPRPWALYDATRVNPALRHRLNALPGITGKWQIEMRSHLRDLDAVNRYDLDYLRNWSPLQDFKILLLTIPKVLSRFGAY